MASFFPFSFCVSLQLRLQLLLGLIAASFLQNNDQNPDDVDEDELQQNEQRVNQGGQAHSSEIGNAAA